MILTFALLILWQGSFAQPQLDGRYGVDRAAMEKKAEEAAQPRHIESGICRVTDGKCVVPFKHKFTREEGFPFCGIGFEVPPPDGVSVLPWGTHTDFHLGVAFGPWFNAKDVMERALIHFRCEPAPKPVTLDTSKPSPQITAVRAVAPQKTIHSSWNYSQVKPFPEHYVTLNTSVEYADGRHFDTELLVDGKVVFTLNRYKEYLAPDWDHNRAINCSSAVFAATQFFDGDHASVQHWCLKITQGDQP